MEEDTTEPKTPRMHSHWKQVLVFSVLFLILAGSLIYFGIPRFLYPPLRRDSIPSGAYIIPWMKPNPSIEELNLNLQLPNSTPPYDIDAVMADALKLNLVFRIVIPDVTIDTPDGMVHIINETRIVPSTIYLGHDSNYLYVGGKFIDMYTNPASTGERIRPNIFSILFDTVNDGVLRYPESGSRLAAYVSSTGPRVMSYEDMMWAYLSQRDRSMWVMAGNYYDLELDRAQPAVALKNYDMEYDIPTGTVTMLLSRYLRQPESSELNALQMRRGERWVMGFNLEVGYNTNSQAGLFVDGWPEKIYPYLNNDASWWPKLVIDLTNPPANM